MNDLAQRLRESAKATFYDPLKSELNEAVNHIEKLEAEFRKLEHWLPDYVFQPILKILEGKND